MSNLIELNPQAIARERARETTGAIGMMLALGAWTMMFASLLFVYLGLRSQALRWPPPGLSLPVALPALNTALMLTSSATLAVGIDRLRSGARRQALGWTALTCALGWLFVALQIVLWRALWLSGITFVTGTLGTVVYALTSLHALHVAGGLCVLAYVATMALRRADIFSKVATLRYCAMYWHFVDAVWLVMFVTIFLL